MLYRCPSVIQVLLLLVATGIVMGTHDAKRLYNDLLAKNYNKQIRPVGKSTDILVIKLGISLTQIIDVVSTNSSGL